MHNKNVYGLSRPKIKGSCHVCGPHKSLKKGEEEKLRAIGVNAEEGIERKKKGQNWSKLY